MNISVSRGLSVSLAVTFIVTASGTRSFGAVPSERRISIQSSSSVWELVDRLAVEFANKTGLGMPDCRASDSDYVATCLKQQKCDVGLVIQSLAGADGDVLADHFKVFPLGSYAVAVAVNSDNRARSISTGELRKIFQGVTTSWSTVGASYSPRPIELYSPLLGMTQSYIFQRCVMHGGGFAGELMDRSTESSRQKPHSDEIVGAIIKNHAAIGFFQFGPDMILDKRIRLLAVAHDQHERPVTPSLKSVAEGRYLIADRLMLYLHPGAPASAREFCKFATGSDGAKIVREFGFWPEYDLDQVRGKSRLKDVKAHRGESIAVSGSAAWTAMMKDMALDCSKAKIAVEMQYQDGGQAETIGKFVEGGELLLLDSTLEDVTVAKYDTAWTAIKPRQVPLGCQGVGLVVHPTNPISVVSFRQLRDLYEGKTRTWAELVPPDVPEQPVQQPAVENNKVKRPAKTRSVAAAIANKTDEQFARPIHFFGPVSSDPANRLLLKKLGMDRETVPVVRRTDVAQLISAVAKDPTAIGLVDLSKLPAGEGSVRVLAISPPSKEPVAPSCRSIPEGYPLVQPVTLWVSSKASQPAKDFAEVVAEGECVDTLLRHGIVPAVIPAKKPASVEPAEGKGKPTRAKKSRG